MKVKILENNLGQVINPFEIGNVTPMAGMNNFESYHAFKDDNPPCLLLHTRDYKVGETWECRELHQGFDGRGWYTMRYMQEIVEAVKIRKVYEPISIVPPTNEETMFNALFAIISDPEIDSYEKCMRVAGDAINEISK